MLLSLQKCIRINLSTAIFCAPHQAPSHTTYTTAHITPFPHSHHSTLVSAATDAFKSQALSDSLQKYISGLFCTPNFLPATLSLLPCIAFSPCCPPFSQNIPLLRYFAPAGSNTKGSLSTSLRAAFGPSFGSLCLASWLLNLLNMLKSAAQSARAENRDNILVQLLVSCFEFMLTVSAGGGGLFFSFNYFFCNQ